MSEKDRRLAEYCKHHGCDGVQLRRRSNIAWITDGADTHVDSANALGIASVLWTPREKLAFTDNIEAARLRDEEFGAEWQIRESPWWSPDDPRPPFTAGSECYATDWPDDAIAELRFSLTAREIERVRLLGRDTIEVVERLLKNDVRPGMTERHLAGAVAGWLRDRGIFAPVVLVAADERIDKYRHPIPTAKPIERIVMVAVCAQRHGLIVSATRLVHFGRQSDDLRRRHDAVCKVDQLLHETTRPGERWCDILSAAQREYGSAGFPDEWQKHHQGGPMGYECRDFKATPTETRRVVINQLVGWNPSITGTKSEDTILVGDVSGLHADLRKSRHCIDPRPDERPNCEVVTASADWPMCDSRPDILVRQSS